MWGVELFDNMIKSMLCMRKRKDSICPPANFYSMTELIINTVQVMFLR